MECVKYIITFIFTHSITLHTHARRHPSRTRASSQSQSTARGSKAGFASRGEKLGRTDGVESTPQHVLEKPF